MYLINLAVYLSLLSMAHVFTTLLSKAKVKFTAPSKKEGWGFVSRSVTFLCGVCMFFLRLCEFSLGSLAVQKHACELKWKLYVVWRCVCKSEWFIFLCLYVALWWISHFIVSACQHMLIYSFSVNFFADNCSFSLRWIAVSFSGVTAPFGLEMTYPAQSAHLKDVLLIIFRVFLH